jgi:membrane fusion protein, multidrug efflux system
MTTIMTLSSSKKTLRIASLVAATALLVTACSKKEEAANAARAKVEPPRPVRVTTVGASDVSDAIYLPGEVRARYEQRFGFRVAGKLARRMVDVGQEVKAGQTLAVLDSQDVMPAINAQAAQVEVARTDLKFQQSELKRQQELREKGFVSGRSALEVRTIATGERAKRFEFSDATCR